MLYFVSIHNVQFKFKQFMLLTIFTTSHAHYDWNAQRLAGNPKDLIAVNLLTNIKTIK